MSGFFDSLTDKLNLEKDRLTELKESFEIIESKFKEYEDKVEGLQQEISKGKTEKR